MAFDTTLWSIVEDAQESGADADAALAVLCETYWKPLYLHMLRRGYTEEEVKDAVQGFFLKMIEKRYLDAADASKGRFRTFLLTCFDRYISNEYKKSNAQKRGGGFKRVSIDWGPVGELDNGFKTSGIAPDAAFDRAWARALIDRAMVRLREHEVASGRGELMEALDGSLFPGEGASSYAEIAQKMGTTSNAVKVAAHRLRKRLRTFVWDEVRLTVNSEEAAELELRFLLNIVSGTD